MKIQVSPMKEVGKFTATVTDHRDMWVAGRCGFESEQAAMDWAHIIARKAERQAKQAMRAVYR